MRPGLIRLLLAPATLPPAYACFVCGWQLVSFTGFAVRLDEGLPGEAWRQIGLTALQFVAIPVALFVAWRAASRGQIKWALAAMGASWIAAAPLLAAVVSR